jgi:hypothetical protein
MAAGRPAGPHAEVERLYLVNMPPTVPSTASYRLLTTTIRSKVEQNQMLRAMLNKHPDSGIQ